MPARSEPSSRRSIRRVADGAGRDTAIAHLVKGVPLMAALMMLVGPLPSRAAGQLEPAPPDPPQSDEEAAIEQLDLQTLLNTPVDVWTPSKAPQKSYEAPSIITIVTREQIA